MFHQQNTNQTLLLVCNESIYLILCNYSGHSLQDCCDQSQLQPATTYIEFWLKVTFMGTLQYLNTVHMVRKRQVQIDLIKYEMLYIAQPYVEFSI